MNVLVFNLRMDRDDPILGHSAAWVEALARHVTHVSVITMSVGRLELPENVDVHSLGKERGLSEPRRLARFYRLVAMVMRERRIDACFAHMAPLFAILFAPIARARRIPVVLWYAHSSVSRTLRLAERVVDRCVTSTADGFRVPSEKLVTLGQGIDVQLFASGTAIGPDYAETVVSVGRISPIKRIDEMIEAIAILDERGVGAELVLFGGPATVADREYEQGLRRLVSERGLSDRVAFEGPSPYAEVASAYHRGAIFLNLSETGSLDKAILESMASGCIPVSRNAAFGSLAASEGLDWLVPGAGPEGVAERLERALACSGERRAALAEQLRRIVVEGHSLESLAGAITSQLRGLAESKGRLRE